MAKRLFEKNEDFIGYKKNKIEVIGIGYYDKKLCKRMYEVKCHNCDSVYYQCLGNLLKVKGDGCKNCKNSYLKTHGMKNDRIYRVWLQMRHRCECSISDFNHYKNYGGRGIKVCDEWKSFENFYDWAISNGYKEELYESGRNKITLDRIDNNGDYCPENCRFVTHKENQWNKRTTRIVVYEGVEYNLKDLALKLDLTIPCLISRIKRWDISRWAEPQRRK